MVIHIMTINNTISFISWRQYYWLRST